MADPENTQVPNGDTRAQNNTESTSNDVGNEVNTADLPDSNGTAPESAPAGSNEETEPKKPSKFKQAWGKLGLDLPTAMMMLKGSIPPTIGIAWYQSNDIAEIYTTLGYLVPIVTVLSMSILPRAKFLQTLFLNVIGTCIAAAIAMLGIWSAIQARKHTTTPGAPPVRYSSSQSVVCAIWLFVNIWFANSFRAKFPSWQFPTMIYSIFTNVAFTFGPIFLTIEQGQVIIKQLLFAFLSAFAIATAVNLFIIPVTGRTVVFKEQAGYLMAVRGALKAQMMYLRSLETSDMFTGTNQDGDKEDGSGKKKGAKTQSDPTQTPEATALKGAIAGLTALHGKLHGDMVFAKREAAWGKLNAKDVDEIYSHFRGITVPLIGMSTIADIFERIAERRGWMRPQNPTDKDRSEQWQAADEEERISSQRTWNEVMKTLHEPFAVVVAAMDEGLQHAGLVLELLPKPKMNSVDDEEAKGADPRPGNPKFAEYMDKKMLDFYSTRGETLRTWARHVGLSEDQFNTEMEDFHEVNAASPDEAKHRRDQQQLYLILFMEHLLYSTGKAITSLVRFADKKVENGTMKKNRLIFPSNKRLKKWFFGKASDTSVDTASPDSLEAGTNIIHLGSGFNNKRDPEHLPPATAWQHFGNGLRTIPRFLSSAECAFGFRVACATLTIGIVAFLERTQVFFQQQRLVWAMIIVAIGMTMTSGQSMFGFFGRVVGTAVAMVTSFVIWYIVNQETIGIIVMLWFFIFLEMYLFLKFPRFIAIWLVAIITQVLIIGYELQVRKIGIEISIRTGQPYYPIYQLAPYRLACVAGGSFVAFFWTIFPFPLTDRSFIRRDLGSTLYLLANYYSVVHTTIRSRVHDTEGDMDSKTSPGRQLEKVRYKIFAKLMMILPSLRQHADWQKWEVTVGGKFPRETYEGIMLCATNITNYLSLISFATGSWTKDGGAEYPNTDRAARRKWLNDLSVLINNVNPTSHQITSILSLLSASVAQGSALPPYMQIPEPFNLSRRLEELDRGVLDARHIEEPGYSAYAVVHVASSLLVDDLARLVDHVKDLVGETDFSFDVSTDLDSKVGSAVPGNSKGKAD